jgi:hypothetical protein
MTTTKKIAIIRTTSSDVIRATSRSICTPEYKLLERTVLCVLWQHTTTAARKDQNPSKLSVRYPSGIIAQIFL